MQNTCRLRLEPNVPLDTFGDWAAILGCEQCGRDWWLQYLPGNFATALLQFDGAQQLSNASQLGFVIWVAPSTVAPEVRASILDLIRRALRPGGVLLVAEGGEDIADVISEAGSDSNDDEDDGCDGDNNNGGGDDETYQIMNETIASTLEGEIEGARDMIAETAAVVARATLGAVQSTNHIQLLDIGHCINEMGLSVHRRYINESGTAWCIVAGKDAADHADGSAHRSTVPAEAVSGQSIPLPPPPPLPGPYPQGPKRAAAPSAGSSMPYARGVDGRRHQRLMEAVAIIDARETMEARAKHVTEHGTDGEGLGDGGRRAEQRSQFGTRQPALPGNAGAAMMQK